jgi:hypothetical protein
MHSTQQRTSWPRPAGTFVGLPVRLGDVGLGRVFDILLGQSLDRVVGLLIAGRGGLVLFLPWAAAMREPDRISIASVFALLSGAELDFYLAKGVRLSEAEGGLRDALVDENGLVRSIESRHQRASLTAERR